MIKIGTDKINLLYSYHTIFNKKNLKLCANLNDISRTANGMKAILSSLSIITQYTHTHTSKED